MGSFTFNIAKGRVAELYRRVDASDPTNAVLVGLVLATSGLESDAVLKDKDTVADLLSGTTDEATNTNYAREIFDDADLAALAPDDTNDRMACDLPDIPWGGGANIAAGSNWSKVVIAYDPDSTGGTDADLIPLTAHDFVVSPNGTPITTTIADFFRANDA